MHRAPWDGMQSELEGNRDTGMLENQEAWAGAVSPPLTCHGSLAKLLKLCMECQSPYLENGHALCVPGRRVPGNAITHLISLSDNFLPLKNTWPSAGRFWVVENRIRGHGPCLGICYLMGDAAKTHSSQVNSLAGVKRYRFTQMLFLRQ